MGRCMLKMGQLEEAHTAFDLAKKLAPNEQSPRLFQAICLTCAQRYEEAKKEIEKLVLSEMTGAELVSLMDVQDRLDAGNAEAILEVLSTLNDSLENKMFIIYGLLFSGKKKQAEVALKDVIPDNFLHEDMSRAFFSFLADMYKMGISINFLISLLKCIKIDSLSSDEMFEYLKVWNGTHAFEKITKFERQNLIKSIASLFAAGRTLSMAYGMLWKTSKDNDAWEKLKELAEKGNEHALLLVVEEQMKNNILKEPVALRNNLQKLVQLDQQNMLYRKYLYEFLVQAGDLQNANVVNQSSMQIRMQQETKRFHLIEQFRKFYHMERTCPICHGKESENCPLCMGTGYMPIIRTIAFNSSPNRVLCEHPEIKYATAESESEIQAILNWQPMNVPSHLAGRYFLEKGAYSSAVPFPDVLVPGQTYVFFKLRGAALKRLAKEGYSLAQIDPLLPVLMSYKKMRLRLSFDEEGKKIKGTELTADDFDIEITRATTEN